jgi:hypothetical protein
LSGAAGPANPLGENPILRADRFLNEIDEGVESLGCRTTTSPGRRVSGQPLGIVGQFMAKLRSKPSQPGADFGTHPLPLDRRKLPVSTEVIE